MADLHPITSCYLSFAQRRKLLKFIQLFYDITTTVKDLKKPQQPTTKKTQTKKNPNQNKTHKNPKTQTQLTFTLLADVKDSYSLHFLNENLRHKDYG